MKYFIFLILLLPNISFSKGIEIDTFLVRKEDELVLLLKNLRSAKTDNEILIANENLIQNLKEVLKYPGVLKYPFEKLTTMSTIKAPDDAFRLFNWNVEDENQKHSHYCFLVKKKGAKTQVIEFKEDKYTLGPRPDGLLSPNKWYGGLYYKIIKVNVGRKTLYTMLSYNGNNRSTNKKIIDVFWFKGRSLRIGYPLFQDERDRSKLHRRVFIEYSEKASISVNYQTDINKIVFDHLMPESPKLKGMYEYYLPDMSYDAYFWEDGFWNYQADIIVGNDKNKSRREYYIDKKTGEEKYKLVSIDWVDPAEGKKGPNNTVAQIENGDKNPRAQKKAIKKDKKLRKQRLKMARKNMSKEDKKLAKKAKKNAKKGPRSSYKN